MSVTRFFSTLAVMILVGLMMLGSFLNEGFSLMSVALLVIFCYFAYQLLLGSRMTKFATGFVKVHEFNLQRGVFPDELRAYQVKEEDAHREMYRLSITGEIEHPSYTLDQLVLKPIVKTISGSKQQIVGYAYQFNAKKKQKTDSSIHPFENTAFVSVEHPVHRIEVVGTHERDRIVLYGQGGHVAATKGKQMLNRTMLSIALFVIIFIVVVLMNK